VDALYRRGLVIFIAAIVFMAATAVAAYFVGRAHSTVDAGTGAELIRATETNRELGAEQQRELERNRGAYEAVERIRGITADANRSLAELGELNRRAGDISAQIRAEADILADYFRGVSGVIDGYADNLGSE